ncbi:MAG: hypothetical protein II059_03290 [Clostridia bacterium]|jgi:hypothetical protein|nr:hypothetical protein [Clostridia bacterium]
MEKNTENVNEKEENVPEAVPESQNAKEDKPKKRQVKVINVPKRRRPLQTPSNIIRLCIVWSFIICIFLLTYPFLSAQLFINDNLEVTTMVGTADLKLHTQDEIDEAAKELKAAIDGLEEAPPDEESSAEPDTSENSDSSSVTSDDSEYEPPIRSIDTANYKWQYSIRDDVDIEEIAGLIDSAKNIDRKKYTEESVDKLNRAVLKAQRTLCATVNVSQSAIQMMVGGMVGESFGNYGSVGHSVMHGIFSFGLAIMPIIGFFAATFDKRRHIKHVIVMICAILSLIDIFLTIYPFVGIGAVLSIIMYILICLLNIASIYTKQQEDFIVSHPEKEAEFTEKHPYLVKALLNAKTFGGLPTSSDIKEQTYQAAKNAQKRNKKKKKSK